ncbi:MAG TPA: 23S rRNA methyltransferase [Streptosporangiaceae bacterium]
MLPEIAGLLVCPVCGASLVRAGPVLRCAAGHSFDVARQGYVNLMPGGARPGTADTAGMVADRAAFLSAGHYAPLASAVADLAAVLGRLGPGAVGLAMDLSARALRRAARAAPGIGAIGWDTWQPFPVRPAAVSVILNVFAPRNGPEFRRVLRPGGALIVATPAPGHLAELAGLVTLISVDEHKDERLAATLGPYFTAAERRPVTVPLRLSRAEAATLAGMGPSARHAGPAATRARLATLAEPIDVTAAFHVTVYRPRPERNGR